MIACICRQIYEADYQTEDELSQRIMQNDFHCGLCQLRYELNDSKEKTEILS